MYEKYKEKIDEFYSKTSGATTATIDEDEDKFNKIDLMWTELNANGHSLDAIKGSLRGISSLQNSGCKQNASVQNKNVRLFCCGSMLDQKRKFVENSEAFCPFFVYCKLNGGANDWNVVVKDSVGANCPYHIPECISMARNVPMNSVLE